MTKATALHAALDIGGTKIAAALVDLASGHAHRFRQMPTQASRGGAHVASIAAQLIAELEVNDAQGVAVGICEIVDQMGVVRSKSAFDWTTLDLNHALQTDLPIHLVSDVRAAALAEARFGAARGLDHAIYVSIGTGISSTLLIQGIPYTGAHGAALVLASAESSQHCEICGTITRQSLEQVASGAGLARRYGKGIDAREIVARAEAGEDAARSLLERAAQQLGQAIAQLANCTDPQAIVIGGGLGGADGLYWRLLRNEIEANLWKDRPATPNIARSTLGQDRGTIGAALAAALRIH